MMVVYETIKDCANKYNIKRATMGSWLRGVRPMPKKFKDIGLKYYNLEEGVNNENDNI